MRAATLRHATISQMSEVIVIARLRVMATDAQLLNYRDRLMGLEPNQAGLLGFSFWRSLEGDGGLMQVMRYRDGGVAEEALEALVHSKIGPLVATAAIDPPDVVVIGPKKQHGKQPEEVPNGAFCTFAIRFADPGLVDVMAQDTDEVLAELAFLPGYMGSFWGNNVTLNDELVSMMFWKSEDAMMSSIPTSHKVKIQKWQKAV